MRRESFAFTILRFLFSLGLVLFMGMLYWSSNQQEQSLREVKNEFVLLRESLEALKRSGFERAVSKELEPKVNPYPLMDKNLPNLLQEDRFYTVTLPKLLGEGFRPRGTLRSSTIGRPNNLHPFSQWAQVSAWISQCTVSVASLQFGKYETFAPSMAIKVEERKRNGVPEYWVFLRDGVYWQPLKKESLPSSIELAPMFLQKQPVTAWDYKFYFDAMMNPSVELAGAVSSRNYYSDVEEIEVLDNLTFVVRWKAKKVVTEEGKEEMRIKYSSKLLTGGLRPLPKFVYAYFADGTKIVEDDRDPMTYRTNSVWAQNFTEHWAKNTIVSCGPYVFEGMSDSRIWFKRNPDFYEPYAALVDGLSITFRESVSSMWQDFKSGKIDTYLIRADQLMELQDFLASSLYAKQEKEHLAIRRLDYQDNSFAYLGWNEKRPFFRDKKERVAMTMAIDRKRIIDQILHGMGVELTGPSLRSLITTSGSLTPWPFNPELAKSILEKEGWFDQLGDGILDKTIDGKLVSFRFDLTYYVKNPTSKAICEYVSTSLKSIGVDCQLKGIDLADLSQVFDDKSFDALYLAWSLGTPPEDPRQLWHSSYAAVKGSSNAISFANKEADKIMETLQYEYDPEKRKSLYRQFDQIIHEEAPYTFLYAPKAALLYREYVQNVFIPADRQDLIPGADIKDPQSSIFWLSRDD